MNDFSPVTFARLSEAGWRGHRRVDTTVWEQTLARYGFNCSPAVSTFLEEFGGLRVRQPLGVDNLESLFHFDVALACQHLDAGLVEGWATEVGEPLCPIGESARGYQGLLMAPTGRVFAGVEETVIMVGKSGHAALEALCTMKLEA